MSIDKIVTKEMTRLKATRNSYETIVALYDIHAPYISEEATKVATQYVTETKPKKLIVGGDFIDNPAMSVFPQDADHKMDTREEIDYAVDWLKGVVAESPDTELIFIDGNHDTARFDRMKSDESKALKNLRGMDFFSQVKASMDEQGLTNKTTYAKKKYELGPGMVFVHGDGRMTPEILGGVNGAKRTADCSAFPGQHIVYGHEHTIGQASSKWGDRQVFKVGAMMDTNVKLYTHMSQYQNGFLVVHYQPQSRPKPRYHVQNIHIQQGVAIIDGKEYKSFK